MNFEKLLGSMVLGIVKSLIAAGVPATKALQYASFIVIEDAFGRQTTLDLGISEQTARRLRHTLRNLDISPLEDESVTSEIESQLVQLLTGIEDLTRDGRVVEYAEGIEEVMKEKGWS